MLKSIKGLVMGVVDYMTNSCSLAPLDLKPLATRGDREQHKLNVRKKVNFEKEWSLLKKGILQSSFTKVVKTDNLKMSWNVCKQSHEGIMLLTLIFRYSFTVNDVD